MSDRLGSIRREPATGAARFAQPKNSNARSNRQKKVPVTIHLSARAREHLTALKAQLSHIRTETETGRGAVELRKPSESSIVERAILALDAAAAAKLFNADEADATIGS